MEAVARAKHIPMSPRKVRRVIDQVRGLDVDEALDILRFLPHAAARPVTKVINSAIANAEDKGFPRDDLYVAKIVADEGPGVMPGKGRRHRYGARGRVKLIRKRSSHITVVLEDRKE